MARAGRILLATLLVGTATRTPASAAEIAVAAPPALAPAAARIRALDTGVLERDLSAAGLALPERIDVALVPDDDPAARRIPRWIVGLAAGERSIVIFPQRVLPYPYDSIESVFRHEVAHLALSTQAGGRPLPRWFHEGVAMSIDRDWDVSSRLRLMLEILRRPEIAELSRLFGSDSAPDAASAYGLAAALVADVQRRHGRDAPGRVAALVAAGVPFEHAFERETGDTPDRAAARAWLAYRAVAAWIPALTSGSAVWTGILVLAGLAFLAVRRRRARRRRQWDEEDARDAEE